MEAAEELLEADRNSLRGMRPELADVTEMVLHLSQHPNAETDYILKMTMDARSTCVKGMGELAHLVNLGNEPSVDSKGMVSLAYATDKEIERQIKELNELHDRMPDGGEVVGFTRKTITRWVATDAYGKEFEGRKTLEVGREILTLGDACTHCFNPDSSSRSDLLKKIDELVRKLGLKSRAEYFLIRGSLNYFYARLYVSRHKKPMPLLIMGVTAHEFLAGKTGPITTTLFDFPG